MEQIFENRFQNSERHSRKLLLKMLGNGCVDAWLSSTQQRRTLRDRGGDLVEWIADGFGRMDFGL